MTRMIFGAWMLIASFTSLYAQGKLQGVVMEESANGTLQPLEFVNVYWESESAATYTDSTGSFTLELPPGVARGGFVSDPVIVSYVGYDPDTIQIGHERYVSIVLKGATTLDEVEVVYRQRTSEVSFLNPRLVENISQGELFKAACCNLSESFETNASVDVLVTDAVSGARELRMLGLAGKYSMISREGMPGIRGVGLPYGLLYTPGSWISSMQLTKGAGSVMNGYESIAGQINVEWKKPDDNEKLFLNGYFNEMLRNEVNANASFDVGTKHKTTVLGHFSNVPKMHDRNGDGFSDNQQGSLYAIANRWKFNNQKGLEGQLAASYIHDSKVAGQIGYDKEDPASGLYGVERDSRRFEVWGKNGFIFPIKRYQSLGLQYSYSYYDQKTRFGNRFYNGTQHTAYGNLIYQSIISSTAHKFRTGGSILYDGIDEDSEFGNVDKDEFAIGGFFEYTYTLDERLTAVAGIRVDYNTLYGWLTSPRLHLRYAPTDNTSIRASVGKGYRSSNPLAENLNLLASSRAILFDDLQKNPDLPYGLKMESAWNTGGSITQNFNLGFRPGSITGEFFYTTFTDQVVVDLDVSPREAHIYNLDGKSYSSSFQIEAAYELAKRLDVKVAYRKTNVKTDYLVGQLQQPLVPTDRGFLNLAYTTRLKPRGSWQFDATVHATGEQRLPTTEGNPEDLLRPERSPAFVTVSGQITRSFNVGRSGTDTMFDVYVGVENALDYRQDDPIIAADDPFGPYFDSGFVWGPIFGRNIYIGVRYALDKRDN